VRILESQDQHVLGHPPFVARHVGRDAEAEALLPEQGITTVSGSERPDLTRFRKVDDVLFRIGRPRDVGLPGRERRTNAVQTRHHAFHIAVDFGDIFYLNSLKSGVLPIALGFEVCADLRRQLHARPGATMKVDLPAQTVTAPDGSTHRFEIDGFRKKCLLEGLDDIGITLQHEAAIAAFETQYRQRFDWLFHGNV
jgi:hypothetical protein